MLDRRVQTSINRTKGVCALFLCLLFSLSIVAQKPEVLDNDKIITMVKAGIGDQVIVQKIAASKILMDASQPGLLAMKEVGVSDSVITAMFDQVKRNGRLINGARLRYLTEISEGSAVSILIDAKIIETKKKAGETLSFQVSDDVVCDGKVVVRKGTAVSAVVLDARKPGRMGRSGRIVIRVDATVTTDGQVLKLRGGIAGGYGDNFGNIFTLWVTDGWAGLVRPKHDAKIKAGRTFVAYANDSIWVNTN